LTIYLHSRKVSLFVETTIEPTQNEGFISVVDALASILTPNFVVNGEEIVEKRINPINRGYRVTDGIPLKHFKSFHQAYND
jgi:hypothetical protein